MCRASSGTTVGGARGAALLIAGLVAGEAGGLDLQAGWGLALVCVAAALMGASLARRQPGGRLERILDITLLVLLVGCGALRGGSARQHHAEMVGAARDLGGLAWVAGWVTPLGDRSRLVVARVRSVGGGRTTVVSPPAAFLMGGDLTWPGGRPSAGAPVQGFVRLSCARGRRGPGLWDDRPFLRARGAVGWAHPQLLAVGDSAAGANPAVLGSARVRVAAARARGWLGSRIAGSLGGAPGSFCAAFFLGRRGAPGLPEEIRRRLQRAGAGHLLAVSGFHVGLLAAVMGTLLRLLPVASGLRWVALALGLGLYGTLVGWGPGVTRAAGAGALWALLRAAGRRPEGLTLLLLVLACVLWSEPAAWREPGLQLSYLVAAALIGVFGSRAPGRRPGGVSRACLAAIAAQATAWPILLAWQGWGSPFFPVANLLLVALAGALPAAVLPGLGLAALPGFPAEIALAVPQAAGQIFLWTAERLARLCDLWILGAGLSPAAGLGTAMLAALLSVFPPAARSVRTALACLPGLAVTIAVVAGAGPGPRILLLDVGQGEAWVVLGERETWLIDLGPAPRMGGRPGRSLDGALRRYGRRRIERIFLTHDDADHTGGCRELAAQYAIDTIYHPRAWVARATTQAWLDGAVRGGARSCALAAGDSVVVDGLRVRVLNPPRSGGLAGDNAGSLALELRADDLGLLVCGDVPGEVQQSWVAEGAVPRVALVSAAHHGSGSSSPRTFLRATGGQVLLISCGRDNRFGHPDPRLLRRAAECGLRVLRTDREGSLLIERSRGVWHVRPYAPGGCSPIRLRSAAIPGMP